MYVSVGVHRSVKYITDCDRSSMLVFYFGKSATVSVSVRFPPAVVCVHHNQSGYLTFRTTKVEDTKLILAVIPF